MENKIIITKENKHSIILEWLSDLGYNLYVGNKKIYKDIEIQNIKEGTEITVEITRSIN